jgi:hypothetical protein
MVVPVHTVAGVVYTANVPESVPVVHAIVDGS